MQEQNGNGILTAEGLVAARRRRVETSLGVATVRALGLSRLVGMLGQLLDISSLAETAKALTADEASSDEGAQRALADSKLVKAMPAIERVIAAGCIEPKLGDDPAAGAVVADLPIEDQLLLFSAILDLSGHSKKAAEEIRP